MQMTHIDNKLAARSSVYGVVLNDGASLQKIGAALDAAPYKGAPKAPVLYIKPANTRVPSGATIALPTGATAVEVGAVIGLVMGRAAARLTPDHALEAVAGIVLAGDLSLPHDNYYRPAIREKCFDGALPISSIKPLVDLSSLVLTTTIDGKLVEQRSLADLQRSPGQLLADVSEFMTLSAGDVLLLGVSYMAPQAGVGASVSVSAEGLGALHFSIAAVEGSAS
jgi:5-oxopent-3-ene-1,2,5-tricarboxylate decarboxylase/2-hydroxyhepta-2,4-diene-1,7-dioate isomerase